MKSIDEVLEGTANKTMLVVFPHPDDESVMAGGIIQRALNLGFEVTVLTLTEGSSGKIFVNGKGRSLAEIRRQEMALAMSRLGVTDWIMWKFDDGKLKRTNKWRERLVSFFQSTRPGVVVSYDLSGVSGHPDHVALAIEVLRLARKQQETKLLWTSFVGDMRDRVVDARVANYLQVPEFELTMNLRESWRKWTAVFAHRSQNLKGFLGSPWWYLAWTARTEWYSEAKPGRRYKYRYVHFKI